MNSVVVPLHAQSSEPPAIFETATMVPTGDLSGGAINAEQFLGVRFQLNSPVTTSAIGMHAVEAPGEPGTVWGAIVALSDMSDLPDSGDMSTPDVLGHALLAPTAAASEVQAPLVLNLAAGAYALVFGGGLFGSTGGAGLVYGNTVIGTPSWIQAIDFPPMTWTSTVATPSFRLFVR